MSLLPANVKSLYHAQVWQWAQQIPSGRVATYGQIAQLLPPPAGISAETYRIYGSRWVGAALAACPEGVPWHRVLNARGEISQRPDAGRQRALLLAEGVVFVKGRLSLAQYQWFGHSQSYGHWQSNEPSQTAGPQQGSLF